MSEHKTKIFISYSHEDESFMRELRKHLVIPGLDIDVFTDEDIMPGQHIPTAISEGIRDADIAVFLLSADFLASRPCMKEWDEAKAAGTVRIPVVVKDCHWKLLLLDSDYIKALPKDGKPIIKYDHLDTAYLEISTGIADVVRERESRFSPKKDFCEEVRCYMHVYISVRSGYSCNAV